MSRYTDAAALDGRAYVRLCKLLLAMFDPVDTLRSFAEQNLGFGPEDGIHWNQPAVLACLDFVNQCKATAKVGRLMQALQEHAPDNQATNELLNSMLADGYLKV